MAVGRSRAAVTNLIRLLDLPAKVIALIDAKVTSMGHARALLGFDDDEERLWLGKVVAERNLSVRETENLVRKALKGEGSSAPKAPDLSVVSEVLRTPKVRVQLQQRTSSAAKLTVECADAASRDVVVRAIKAALNE